MLRTKGASGAIHGRSRCTACLSSVRGMAQLPVRRCRLIPGPRYAFAISCTNPFAYTSSKRRRSSVSGGAMRKLLATPWLNWVILPLSLPAATSFAVAVIDSRSAATCARSTMPRTARTPSRCKSSMARCRLALLHLPACVTCERSAHGAHERGSYSDPPVQLEMHRSLLLCQRDHAWMSRQRRSRKGSSGSSHECASE